MEAFVESRQGVGPLATNGSQIISLAQAVGLDPRLLYEAVIDLSAEGLLTANCINFAAGILLRDLGLPSYFFDHIEKLDLIQLLQAIASNIRVVEGKADLFGRVANIDFDLSYGSEGQRVRIATEETRDSMEKILEELLSGHRREYYFSPESGYYTYIIRPGTFEDFTPDQLEGSRFLFGRDHDFSITPGPTRKRYEQFLQDSEASVLPLIKLFNLPETGETRIMFRSDFQSPQLPMLRKILADQGYTLGRAYWEPYVTNKGVSSSICSLYLHGEVSRKDEAALVRDLGDFLAFAFGPISELYLAGRISFKEMLFGGNGIDFAHLFIFKESENATDREILEHLQNRDHQDALAKRIQDSNKSTYGLELIEQTVMRHPDLISELYALFEQRFDPKCRERLNDEDLAVSSRAFESKIASRFIDFSLGRDIFQFLLKLISCTLKTNFFCNEKRSFSFRFDNRILDPLVFSQFVYGIFFVNGHYARGTHMRAADIARGGLRLLRVSQSNHDAELDGAVLLNYALGPKAQRIKHKDICESGSKGVVVPHPIYARYSKDALLDFTEGILDLILDDQDPLVDYYAKQEMIFFGPDEGTAQLMDHIALRARERGYSHWHTLTTGKSFGIPHDTYGLLNDGRAFGLFSKGEQGVELQIDGQSVVITTDMAGIYDHIGDSIEISGMTTTSVMSSFRTLISANTVKEEDLNLMITGGPDGDLGANEIQCYKGRICLIIDGGSILFDPQGLDHEALCTLALSRNTDPRLNSRAYPAEKLSSQGFQVLMDAKDITLPSGQKVADGALFHRTFLTDPANREILEQANIRAFIPCGGFKDTVNRSNVRSFLANFQELEFIVEGANVFFDDGARRHIASQTAIKQIKDSTANKGGVFSSSIAEVLTGFLLGGDYQSILLDDTEIRWGLVKDIMSAIKKYAEQETSMLLSLHQQEPLTPLFQFSEISSEDIFALQERLMAQLDQILEADALIDKVLQSYIPPVLVERLGMDTIRKILDTELLKPYRDSIITKKLASTAYYRFGTEWHEFLADLDKDLIPELTRALA